MTCAATAETLKWTCGLALALGLAACQMDNPAFGATGKLDEVGDASSTESGSSGAETGESSSSSGPETTTTDTADTSDLSTSASEGMTEPDLPSEEACPAEFHAAYAPVYGSPDQFDGQVCPLVVTGQYLKITGAGPTSGIVLGQRCAGGCVSCSGESIPFGVAGLEDFSAPILAAVQNQQIACVQVEVGAPAGLDESSRCRYDSLWVGNFASDLLLALHHPPLLSPAGLEMLAGKQPPVPGLEHVSCTCASLYEPASDDLTCCESSMVAPTAFSSLTFLGADVMPGASAVVVNNGTNFNFHVAQAEQLPNCENGNGNDQYQMSWALVHVP